MYVNKKFEKSIDRRLSRRRFVQGVLAGGAIAAFDLWRWPALAAQSTAQPNALSGSHFDLVIQDAPVNFTGQPAVATTVNGMIPGPLLRWREGDTVTISVTNHLKKQTSIHWHGVRTPSEMDGVPGLSFPGIDPGQTFTYRLPVRQRGTYWYHAHSDFQEQIGLYAPIIIQPAFTDPIVYDREFVILLSDWTDEDPMTVYSNLKQQSDYYNYHRRTVGTLLSDVRTNGLGATLADRMMWGAMNMSPTDLSDVSGATYTYLLNGYAPAANWTALFRPHERIRLRFINASAMTIFDVRIPGLPMTVVQSDGNDVEPVTVDEFRISLAETYDVVVEPHEEFAYTIFAQSFDRTGYARGTLAPRPGMSAPVPPMDPRPTLTMADMGMGSMSGMPAGPPGSDMSKMPGMDMPGMNTPEAKPSMPAATGTAALHEMDMSGMSDEEMKNMPGMEMPAPSPTPSPPPSKYRSWTGESVGQPGPNVIPVGPPSASGNQIVRTTSPLTVGPEVDNVAMMPTDRLNEPGVGLNGSGRRVLTYADLRALYRSTDLRAPSREIELHLTGNMERFIWGFDGKKLSEAEPIRLRLGERVRIVLINDSMMNHPIHLHGLWSELDNGKGEFRPYKHTINVKPGERLSFLVSADKPGAWAFHCHLLYHMEAGMFRTVIVS
jgi:CopA family copper-resistance protein